MISEEKEKREPKNQPWDSTDPELRDIVKKGRGTVKDSNEIKK
jgi:hypothetical protein